MPAFSYLAAFAMRTAAVPSCSRRRSSTDGPGVSSMSFWWRRWHRAIALAEPHHVAGPVGEQLHLDVTGLLDRAFEVDAPSPNAVVGLGRSRAARQALSNSCFLPDRIRIPLPPPPPAGFSRTG